MQKLKLDTKALQRQARRRRRRRRSQGLQTCVWEVMARVGFSCDTYYHPSIARRSLLRPSIAGSTPKGCKVCVRAQLVPFNARRQVDVPFQSGALAPELYVKEVERVVKVTFPDSARIRFLGDSTWRATLKPVSFFNLSATPACDIRVFHENTALKIRSNKLVLDLKGIPQFKHLDFDFSLSGQLNVAESASKQGGNRRFQGWVDLGLKVDMPLPFSMMPEAILTPVGNGILDRILGAMESALLAGLIRDYKQWCRIQSDQPLPLSTSIASHEKLSSS